MSDWDEGNNCPMCECTMMNGTNVCFACGYNMEEWCEDVCREDEEVEL